MLDRPLSFGSLLLVSLLAAAGCMPEEASDAPPYVAPTVDAMVHDTGEVALDEGVVDDAEPPEPDAEVVIPRTERPAECGEATVGTLGSAGGEILAGAAAGAFVDARLTLPEGAIDGDAELTMDCADDLVPEGFTAVGPALRVGTGEVLPLDLPARLRLVYDATELDEAVVLNDLRLFWQPENQNYVAEPMVIDLQASFYGGTFEFRTPGLGVFQLGHRDDAGESYIRRYTYRAATGISMGGGAAAYLGTKYHDYFDYVVPMGGPVDWPYMMFHITGRLMGGFCTADGVGGVMGEDWCGVNRPLEIYEHEADYLFWFYSDSGGSFDRSEYLQIFQDLSYAYGNPLHYSVESPYLPPGVPISELRRPAAERCLAECRPTLDTCQADGDCGPTQTCNEGTCECPPHNTFTIAEGFFDDEYNPDGTLPVITFCDGEDGGEKGVLSDVPHREPVEILLAVDVNGNGRRDLFEPVIRNTNEPYEDLGCDGLANEDEVTPGDPPRVYDAVTNPDPAGDDHDWYMNPNGTEDNWLFDGAADCDGAPGEPYDDFGLDGVAGTAQQGDEGGYDFGEGNGHFDYNPNFKRFLDRNAGHIFQGLTRAQQRRLQFWTDAGIRDLFNFATAHSHMMARFQASGLNVRIYDSFSALFQNDDETFFPSADNFDAFGDRGESVFVRYGDLSLSGPDVDEGELEDGAHVGSVPQALNRFMTMFEWIHTRWPTGDYSTVAPPYERGDTVEFFESEAFGKMYRYGISLPPGYNQPASIEADTRYPVVLLMHGYGMGPEDLPVAGPLLAGQMASGAWLKSIVIFPEGFCGDSSQFQCNDGLDNDGDGYVDSTNDRTRRVACESTDDCSGDYTCREASNDLGMFCCPPDWEDCGPPDETCGTNREGHTEGDAVTLCNDGVDNDRDGTTDLDDEGCVDDATHNTEADCKQGSFYTTHIARVDGVPGGPDFEGAMLDMLHHVTCNYRVKRPECVQMPEGVVVPCPPDMNFGDVPACD